MNPIEELLNKLKIWRERFSKLYEDPQNDTIPQFQDQLKELFGIDGFKTVEPAIQTINLPINSDSILNLRDLEPNIQPVKDIFKNLDNIKLNPCEPDPLFIPEIPFSVKPAATTNQEEKWVAKYVDLKTTDTGIVNGEYNGVDIPFGGKIISNIGNDLEIELDGEIEIFSQKIIEDIKVQIDKRVDDIESYINNKEYYANNLHTYLVQDLFATFFKNSSNIAKSYINSATQIITKRKEFITKFNQNSTKYKILTNDNDRNRLLDEQRDLLNKIESLTLELDSIKSSNGFYGFSTYQLPSITIKNSLQNASFQPFYPKNSSLNPIQILTKLKNKIEQFSNAIIIGNQQINLLTQTNILNLCDPTKIKINPLNTIENKSGVYFSEISSLETQIIGFKPKEDQKNLDIEKVWREKLFNIHENFKKDIIEISKEWTFYNLQKNNNIDDQNNPTDSISYLELKSNQFINIWKDFITKWEENQQKISNYEDNNDINIKIEGFNSKYWNQPSIFKMNNINYYIFSRKTTQLNEQGDLVYNEQIKLPNIKDIKIESVNYWKKWCQIATIVNLNPLFWPIGFILPGPNGIIKIPFPIIWRHITTIQTPLTVFVIGIAICGACPCPFIYAFNPGWEIPILGINRDQSYFLVGVRGPVKISDKIENRTFLDLIPKKDNLYKIREELETKTITFSWTIFNEINKKLPLEKEDHPPYEKLSLKNLQWVNYLTKWCEAGKKTYGFFENP
jgi:hypothetical protein